MRLRFWLTLAVVAAGGFVFAGIEIHGNERGAFEQRQRDEALRSARQTEALVALSVHQLASAAAFYRVEGHLTQHEFHVVARSLLGSNALATTGFVQSLSGDRRAQFERVHGIPVMEGSEHRRHSAGRRAHYFPLTFAASDDITRLPLGYDMGADPVRGRALRHARDAGHPVASPVTQLLTGGDGINVFRPVYRDRTSPSTLAQRRRALIGFAVGTFRIPDLVAAATSALPADIAIDLLEGNRVLTGPELSQDGAATAQIRIADRSWLLVVHDYGSPGLSLAILISVLGVSLAALLGAVLLISSRNQQMRELQTQASQDSLTGLKNRRRFEEDARMELARSRRGGACGALLMLDLDNFKQVNDSLGHPSGDRVIEEIAGVLRGRTRETDVLARLGGDEFAVVLPHCDSREAQAVAETIATAIREHIPRQSGIPPITASIGIAMFGPNGSSSFDSIVAEADSAMYAAKSAGRDAVRVAAAGDHEATPEPSRPNPVG